MPLNIKIKYSASLSFHHIIHQDLADDDFDRGVQFSEPFGEIFALIKKSCFFLNGLVRKKILDTGRAKVTYPKKKRMDLIFNNQINVSIFYRDN